MLLFVITIDYYKKVIFKLALKTYKLLLQIFLLKIYLNVNKQA